LGFVSRQHPGKLIEKREKFRARPVIALVGDGMNNMAELFTMEVKTDPEVAPLPPHVTLKEARAFMSAMARGDGGAGHVIGETARQVVDGLFGKKD
jgi:hypothetical protein